MCRRAPILSVARSLLLIYLAANIIHLEQQVAAAVPLSSSLSSSWGGVCGNPSISQIKTEKRFASSRSQLLSLAAAATTPTADARDKSLRHRQSFNKAAAAQRLANDPIHVRLNIVYDNSLEEEHRNNTGGVRGYIKDLIYSLQLIYEQPELGQHLKFNFVVTSLKLTSEMVFQAGLPSEELLKRVSHLPEVISERDRADMHVFLFYRTMGTPRDKTILINPDPRSMSKILGLANLATYCAEPQQPLVNTMVLSAGSLGTAPVFAHEIAHALGVWHDGEPSAEFERHCAGDQWLMLPTAGPDHLHWSRCTVDRLIDRLGSERVFNCIYWKARVDSARPVSEEFDFNPLTAAGQTNRRSLPGELVPIDEQCSRYVAKNSQSTLTVLGETRSYTTCQSLVCSIGRKFLLDIGPAPPGSACKTQRLPSKVGRCSNARCEGTS